MPYPLSLVQRYFIEIMTEAWWGKDILADVIDYNLYGNDMQIVEIELDADEGVRAEAEPCSIWMAG